MEFDAKGILILNKQLQHWAYSKNANFASVNLDFLHEPAVNLEIRLPLNIVNYITLIFEVSLLE